MPTKRLCDWDRQQILSATREMAWRPLHMMQLGLTAEEITDFLWSLVPQEVAREYTKVRSYAPFSPCFNEGHRTTVRFTDYGDDGKSMRVTLCHHPLTFPKSRLRAKQSTGPVYDRIVSFAMEYAELFDMTCQAMEYARDAIEHCSSAGQVERLLPGLGAYMPVSVRETLANAERRSRVPADFTAVPHLRDLTMSVVARGALCPVTVQARGYSDNSPGVVEVQRRSPPEA